MKMDESNAFFLNDNAWETDIDRLSKCIKKSKEDKMFLYSLIKNNKFCYVLNTIASNIIYNDKKLKTIHELQLQMTNKLLELNDVCRSYNIYHADLLPLSLDIEDRLKDIKTRYSNK